MENYTLDIKKTGRQFLCEGFRVGDNGMRTLCFHFTCGGESFFFPQDSSATIYALLPDGQCIYHSCELIGDTVIYSLSGGTQDSASITSYPGKTDCEIRVTSSSGEVITSPKFSILVEDILQNDDAIEAQSSFSALTDTLARLLEKESQIAAKADTEWVISYIEETFLGGAW